MRIDFVKKELAVIHYRIFGCDVVIKFCVVVLVFGLCVSLTVLVDIYIIQYIVFSK